MDRYDGSLKKRDKVRALKGLVGSVEGQRCLLITTGDSLGVLIRWMRAWGGNWFWLDLREGALSGSWAADHGELCWGGSGGIGYPSDSCDLVVVVDVHEHLRDARPLNTEIVRILKPGGRIVVTTPNNTEGWLVTRLRYRLGMTKEVYGHVREGYTVDELIEMFRPLGIRPGRSVQYAGVVTELIELAINSVWAKGLSARYGKGPSIVPSTPEEIQAISGLLRIYRWIFPFLWLLSRLDRLLPFLGMYAVVLEGEKV